MILYGAVISMYLTDTTINALTFGTHFSIYRYYWTLVRTSCVFTRLLHVLRDGPLEK